MKEAKQNGGIYLSPNLTESMLKCTPVGTSLKKVDEKLSLSEFVTEIKESGRDFMYSVKSLPIQSLLIDQDLSLEHFSDDFKLTTGDILYTVEVIGLPKAEDGRQTVARDYRNERSFPVGTKLQFTKYIVVKD